MKLMRAPRSHLYVIVYVKMYFADRENGARELTKIAAHKIAGFDTGEIDGFRRQGDKRLTDMAVCTYTTNTYTKINNY